MHYEPFTAEIEGKLFYLAHGDGLGDKDRKFLFLRAMFHNPVLQRLFACIHPRWSVEFGLEWAKHSRLKHEREGAPRYMGEQNEPLIIYSKEYLKSHPDINYFIYGHRHIELDLMLTREARLLILGEWVDLCTYAVFDGKELRMENFIEGETQP
jgi:UDP-2,3-diacylglucosamine hydrolase